jgi:hypothetical protein
MEISMQIFQEMANRATTRSGIPTARNALVGHKDVCILVLNVPLFIIDKPAKESI